MQLTTIGSGSGLSSDTLHVERFTFLDGRHASFSASFAEMWEQVAGPMSPSVYPAGVQFLEQGSSNFDVYFIRRGIIKLQSVDRAGRETIVGIRRTGGLVGAEAAVLRKPHLASALTVTDCCLDRFPIRQFYELVRKHPELSWRLHQISANELREMTAALAEVKSHTANMRLKRLILELMSELQGATGHDTESRLPFKQWEIAQILGITPEHLSRLLRRLEKEGFLNRKGAILTLRISHNLRKI